MPKVHKVKQGETLTKIAKKYKFSSIEAIYDHDLNEEFRKERPDPNMLYPGDEINIPDIEATPVTKNTNGAYSFMVKRLPKEVFRIKIEGKDGLDLSKGRVVMDIAGQKIDGAISPGGVIEIELPDDASGAGNIDIFMKPDSDEPTHSYEVTMGHLDPVEQLSGVQARCNMLGFPCGVPDGLMGRNTRNGVKEFQETHGLDVDGVPGPMTKAKLKEVYGC